MPTYDIIDGTAVDLSVKTLIHTFLSAYFDGAAHDVGTRLAVTFPLAGIAFDQGPVKQPLQAGDPPAGDGLEIRVIFDVGRMERYPRDGGYDILQMGTIQFWVRSKVQSPDLRLNSKQQTQDAADLLHDLLNNPLTTIELADAGLGQFRPRKQTTKQNTNYVIRMVSCGVRISYQTTF